MKDFWYFGRTASRAYDPYQPVLPGCVLEQERRALNAKYFAEELSTEELKESVDEMYRAGKGKLRRDSKFVPLSILVGHGDMLVMHGVDLQKYYEVPPLP